MKKIFSFILVLTMMLSIVPQAYAAEEGTLNEWVRNFTNCKSDSGSIIADSSTSRSGNSSAKITYSLPMQNNRYINFSTIVRGLKNGAKYKCGVSVKAEQAGSILLTLGWEDRHSLTPIGKTFDWIDLSYNFTNTKGFTNMDFILLVESATKAVWFDNVYFREVKEDGTLGPNLVLNGTFDTNTSEEESENEQVNGLYALYKDIESREKFTLSEIKQVLGAFKYAPVYKASGIAIDGELSEWDGYPKFGLPTKPDQYQVYIKGAEQDVDAYCQYAYDEENFYLAIYVKDDIFCEDKDPDMYWNGDSIQLAICDVGQIYDAEIGFAHHADGTGTVHSNTHGESVINAIDLKTTQKGDEIIYEAKIPWSIRYKDGVLPEGFLFDVIVNDNDGKGRAYCVELAPGISEGKNSAEFPYLEFMTDKKDYYAWLQGPDTATEGEETEFSYYLVNEGDEKAVTITTSSGQTETITLPAQSGIRRTYKPVFSGFGNQEFAVEVNYGSDRIASTYDVNIRPGLASFEPLFAEMDAMAAELKGILDQCTAQGIATDYELVNYKVIERFCTIIREDYGAGEFDRAVYVYNTCKELFEEAKASCQAYLAGEKTPQVVTRFKTGEVTIDGPMVYATTETNGVMEKRPYFFTGYGHFEVAIDPDLDHFEQFGVNLVQLSMDPAWGVITPVNGDEMFKFDHNTGIVKRMRDYIKRAEEHNMQICVVLGIHDLGSTILNAYPQLRGQSVADVIVQQGDIKLHPIMKKLIDVQVQGVLETVGDSPALHSICLTNEPTNNANCDFYKPYWALYLAETYNADISALNAAYGTNYENFIDVPMPEGTPSNRWFYDYKQFNDDIVNQYHEYIAQKIREINPNIPLHVKMMGMSRESEKSRNFLTFGTDHELEIDVSDYNGNDSYGMLYNGSGWNLLEGIEFYDMQMGMNKAPIFNSEDHVISDGDTNFEPLHADFVETSQWQGYIHGKAASTIWSWDRSYDKTSGFYGTVDCRPDVIAKVGHTNFDANRVAYEIESIVEKEPEIALITSTNARVFSLLYMNSQYKAYTNLLYNGQKVRFIPESQMDQLKDYKALVLTNLNNVKYSTLMEIKEFADNGGKILMLGDDCIKYNEYNEPHPQDIVAAIRAKSQIVPTTDDGLLITSPTEDEYFNLMANLAKEINEDKVVVIDTKTGDRVRDVEITYADYNGSIVLNMSNYSYDETPKSVKIYVNGEQAKNIYNLRREYQMSDVVELQRYQPVFVRLGDNSMAPAPAPAPTPAPAAKELKVVIDGEEYNFTEAKPYSDSNNRVLVPIRFIAEALEADVDWKDGVVIINKGEDVIEYTLGEYFALFNGERKEFDTCGEAKNDRVFVPVRYISELLSADVEWIASDYTVSIKSK